MRPEIRGRRCLDSPFGWLVVAAIDNSEIHLFNPLSRAPISFPTFTHHNQSSHLQHWCINQVLKVVISNNLPNCMVVVAIYSCYRMLALAKPGDHVWSLNRLEYQWCSWPSFLRIIIMKPWEHGSHDLLVIFPSFHSLSLSVSLYNSTQTSITKTQSVSQSVLHEIQPRPLIPYPFFFFSCHP